MVIPARRYGSVSAQLRVAAVAQVHALAPRPSSRCRAICLVADAVAVSPNTLRAWVVAAGDPPPARHDDPARAERERAPQLAAQVIRDLSHALHHSPPPAPAPGDVSRWSGFSSPDGTVVG